MKSILVILISLVIITSCRDRSNCNCGRLVTQGVSSDFVLDSSDRSLVKLFVKDPNPVIFSKVIANYLRKYPNGVDSNGINFFISEYSSNPNNMDYSEVASSTLQSLVNKREFRFWVKIRENCTDSIKTYYLNEDIWTKYKQYQLDKMGTRGFNYGIDVEYCR